MIQPLNTQDATLEDVGGKGANLAMLAHAGFPVPGGFTISTAAYRQFVAVNQLEGHIQESLQDLSTGEPSALKAASEQIRTRFSEGSMPPEIAASIGAAYAGMGAPPVAVRSSATTEDLPEMSFAGQQDTFLNVIGVDDLCAAVIDCWSSLWTARAIGYRARYAVPHTEAALAVVVQEMVGSQASGVLFSANPLNGLRSQVVIEAALGLGEALVSGQVEPDQYIVEMTAAGGRISSKSLGAKALSIHGLPGGGTHTVEQDGGGVQALPDEAILVLAEMGQRVAEIYAFPQDIEWAWADGELYLLQSRPITSLYPLLEGMEPEPLHVMASLAAVQGMLDPLTLLGQDAIRLIFAGGGRLFGFQRDHDSQAFILAAGERLWGDVTTLLRNPIGRKSFPIFLALIEVGMQGALENLLDDSRLPVGRVRLSTMRRIAGFGLRMLARAGRVWLAPDRWRERILRKAQEQIDNLEARSAAIRAAVIDQPDPWGALSRRVELYGEIYNGFIYAIPHCQRSIPWIGRLFWPSALSGSASAPRGPG